jgi:hypothetical protein
MLSKLRPRSIYDVMAAIACFVALAGGTAYAANTIRTGDIVDNEVFTTDVRNDTLGFGGLTHPDLGPGSVRSSEIADGSVTRFDIGAAQVDSFNLANNAVFGSDVLDGGLKDEDIAQLNGVNVNFTENIGTVPAGDCIIWPIENVNAPGDHLLLTPDSNTTNANLSYTVEHHTSSEADIKVCNPTDTDINDGSTNFNLLEIDAQ